MNKRRQGEGVFIDNPNPQPSWRKRDLAGSHDNFVCLAGKLEEDILCGFRSNSEGEVRWACPLSFDDKYFPKLHDNRKKQCLIRADKFHCKKERQVLILTCKTQHSKQDSETPVH